MLRTSALPALQQKYPSISARTGLKRHADLSGSWAEIRCPLPAKAADRPATPAYQVHRLPIATFGLVTSAASPFQYILMRVAYDKATDTLYIDAPARWIKG